MVPPCRRPAYQSEKERIEGAVCIPMFRPVAGTDGWNRLKKVVMGSLAMAATGDAPLLLLKTWAAHRYEKHFCVLVIAA